MLMEPEKSRLRQNFFAYGFVAANIAHGAQEYYPIAYLTEEDHLGIFYASFRTFFMRNGRTSTLCA